jgi:hypothetical protein
MPILEEEFNEISAINDYTNIETTQFIDEASFNHDLQLIKKL